MKRLLPSLLLASITWVSTAQTVIPIEDFNGCSLPDGWENMAVNGPNNWLFGDFAPGGGSPGSIDGSCFAFIDDDDLGPGAPPLTADLITPVIDLSEYANASLTFDYIFQSIGTSSLSVSLWNGESWDVAWTETTAPNCFGFYPDCEPRQAEVSLVGYLNADFRAKFTYDDGEGWSWWAAVDNIALLLPPSIDAAVTSILSPVTGCGLGTEAVSIRVQNTGQTAITEVTATYTVNGGEEVTETFTLNLQPGASITLTFTETVDLSEAGTYAVNTSIEVDGDLNGGNNSASTTINSIPLFEIEALPYFQDFEDGDGGWTAGGANSSWALGTPAGTFISAAFSGDNAFVTNLTGSYNNNEASYIESPCMDFSSLVIAPVLRFKQIFQTEDCCDGGWVDISVNGGQTWTRLGTQGSGTNWYNNGPQNRWNGTSGAAGQWRTAMHLLNGAAGQSSVKLRFFFSSDGSVVNEGFGIDDIEIFEQPSVNAELVSITSPQSGCSVSDAEVKVVIRNLGEGEITGFNVTYDIGDGPVTEVYSDVLLSGETDTFTFATVLDLPVGSYSLTAYVSVANDGDTGNDTLTVSIISTPVVTGLPYVEDFEDGPGGWYAETVSGDANSWQWGQPGGTFIPEANSGDNAWVTNLNGSYENNEDNFIISPCFDFSDVVLDPILSFAHIFATEDCCDGGWVDMSVDGGSTWSRLGTMGSGTNWYNNQFANRWNGTSGDPGVWRNASHLLTGTAGESAVRIRFYFRSDVSIVNEGFGVDDVRIDPQPDINGALLAILAPLAGCALSDEETVTVRVANVGVTDISPVSVSYSLDGAPAVTQQWDLTLGSLDTLELTFDETIDLSVPGDYTVTAWVNVPGDGDNSNDTLSVSVSSILSIAEFPYFQDFENGNGGWSSTGINGTWELGDPTGNLINAAYSGMNALATNLSALNYQDNQLSHLVSPCLDFSGLEDDPFISFAIIFDTEQGWDGAWLEVSTNGGQSYSVLGTVGSGENWYVNDNNNWWDGQSGGNTSWVIAEHLLAGTAGQSEVRIRFVFESDGSVSGFEGVAVDDIRIFPRPELDLAVVSFDGPMEGCSLGQLPVTFTFRNKGLSTVSSFGVGFRVDGGAVQTETVTASLAHGESLTYTFSTELADLSSEGPHTIDVFTMLADDENPWNDTLFGNVVVNHGSSTPLAQSLEPNAPVSDLLPNGTASTMYFCGLPSSLNGSCTYIGSVTINSLTHTFLSDLDIFLISPAGDTVLLSSGNGGSGDDMVNVAFDANSTNDITLQALGIASGTYAPQDPNGFSTFYDGQDPNGGWTLFIRDLFGGDDGILEQWSMEMVDDRPEPVLAYTDTIICLSQVLDVNTTMSYESYLWSTGQNTAVASLSGSVLGLGDHEVYVTVNQSGCSGTSNSFTLTVDECLSVGISELLDGLSVYPNPNDGLFMITGQLDEATDLTITMMDMTGRVVMTPMAVRGAVSINHQMDISGLSKGLYLLRVQTVSAEATLRVSRQ
jgi:subtilisin-like proprotein convertase family protein